MKKFNIIIAVGGNIYSETGDHPIETARKAINSFDAFSISVKKSSSWYVSEPIPNNNQPNFYNCVVLATTILDELNVLKSLHKIETKFGRKRHFINESRTLDLDLIDYEGKVIENKNIIIPHPRAHLRRFVMEPLFEVASEWNHPKLKKNVKIILKKLKKQSVKIYLK